jgi:hypothetical protein
MERWFVELLSGEKARVEESRGVEAAAARQWWWRQGMWGFFGACM